MIRALALALALLVAGCGSDSPSGSLPDTKRSFTLTSGAFADGMPLPRDVTCDGSGIAPPLRWAFVPGRAKELTLVVEDPDAKNFVHWIVLGIAPTVRGLSQGALPSGAVEARNGFGKPGWGPPCPPEGDPAHHYVFSLYATDAPLGLDASASIDDVRRALDAHALSRGTLTGTYRRG